MIDYRNDARWKVYIHIVPKSLSNHSYDKYYVGITGKENPNDRWDSGYGYLYNKHFTNAIRKYGWNNIIHEVIANNLTKSEACDMEIAMIKALDSNNPKYGYNITAGGEGTNGFKHSDQTKMQMSMNRSGSKNSFYGKRHSEKTKRLISMNHADFSGAKSSKSKRIFQYSINGEYIAEYRSINEAERHTGVSHQAIGKVARGKSKHAGGFIWSYEKRQNVKPVKVKTIKRIRQLDEYMNELHTYKSGNDASNITGFSSSSILSSCKTGKKYKNYYWSFA